MYKPSAFLISAAALTTIFSFFFGAFFQERESTYRLWIKLVAYGATPLAGDEKKNLCAELESRRRTYLHYKVITGILLVTMIVEFIIFQAYSLRFADPRSHLYETGAFDNYVFFNTAIGVIVIASCLEILYMRLTINRLDRFPYIKVRKRVEGKDRLAMMWQMLYCRCSKRPEYDALKIPRYFYETKPRSDQVDEFE